MRTSENKICDNQPHTEAVGKERQFNVFVCVCECHDQEDKIKDKKKKEWKRKQKNCECQLYNNDI
jgi:hypothetical protein